MVLRASRPRASVWVIALCVGFVAAGRETMAGDVLDGRAQLDAESFWDNRDFDGLLGLVPAFDCPDRALRTTYYYRWELLTKHLTYASPATGYIYTEFLDRPFWSGAYGAISCPAGHQLAEARWIADPRYSWDYARYWLRTPGAQPRRYSTWLAAAVLEMEAVHHDPRGLAALLPDLVKNFEGWEREHWNADMGLFWQTGHDDGMEYNINSRQTRDILRGGPGYRTTLNSYMAADAAAIGVIARRAGDGVLAARFGAKAKGICEAMHAKLWDANRGFYFQRFRDDETGGDGERIRAGTLTYETGKHAGSRLGRELYNYVPWMFDATRPGRERDGAWSNLMRLDGFFGRFGPTTVERRDPQFLVSKTCCWWSGNSWPYATSQTLEGLARLLQSGGGAGVIGREDYAALLGIFARTHRRGGVPYLGEACDPDTGSWEGHDARGHSDHYFHSSFCDLVITGLMGIRPLAGENDAIEVAPLIPDSWPYAAVDGVSIRGRRVTVVWDKTGERYGKGAGLRVLVDGKEALRTGTLGASHRVVIGEPVIASRSARMNYAVNNDGLPYPRLTASAASGTAREPLFALNDGNTWYHAEPPNRWTTGEAGRGEHWIGVDFCIERVIDAIELAYLDDGAAGPARPPARYAIEERAGAGWRRIEDARREPAEATGHRPNIITFAPRRMMGFRLVMESASNVGFGLSEIGAWGPAEEPYRAVAESLGNLALGDGVKARASYESRFDRAAMAINGVSNFRANPVDRWTAYESPSGSDWLEVDFGRDVEIGHIEIGFYDDGGGVRAPAGYEIEVWAGGVWSPLRDQRRMPGRPVGGQFTTVRCAPAACSKLRVVLTHAEGARSGIVELEAYSD
jgi:hypothetical protein